MPILYPLPFLHERVVHIPCFALRSHSQEAQVLPRSESLHLLLMWVLRYMFITCPNVAFESSMDCTIVAQHAIACRMSPVRDTQVSACPSVSHERTCCTDCVRLSDRSIKNVLFVENVKYFTLYSPERTKSDIVNMLWQ